MQQNDQDIRKELGIRDIFSSCYETNDNRFVKVIDVSAVNLSLMSSNERQKYLLPIKHLLMNCNSLMRFKYHRWLSLLIYLNI